MKKYYIDPSIGYDAEALLIDILMSEAGWERVYNVSADVDLVFDSPDAFVVLDMPGRFVTKAYVSYVYFSVSKVHVAQLAAQGIFVYTRSKMDKNRLRKFLNEVVLPFVSRDLTAR